MKERKKNFHSTFSLQTGQEPLVLSHVVIQGIWNLWIQFNKTTFSSLNSNKQTGHLYYNQKVIKLNVFKRKEGLLKLKIKDKKKK